MEKILIVEDDEMICCGIVDTLQLRNWETETAASFSEAMKKIKTDEYMLYILDMKFPDGNGIALCREIRKKTYRKTFIKKLKKNRNGELE